MNAYYLISDLITGNPAIAILRISDSAFIPPDPDNTDYQAYLAWCEDGNVAAPYPPPIEE